MKRIILTLFAFSFFFSSLLAQNTEDFEDETVGANSFISNSLSFSTSSNFEISTISAAGWNGSASDDQFLDNINSLGAGAVLTITPASNVVIKSLWIYVSDDGGNNPGTSTGSISIDGKLSSSTQFNISKNTGFNTALATAEGFTFIDFATEGASDYSSVEIDELVITASGSMNYFAIDAFIWELAPSDVTPPTFSVAPAVSNEAADGFDVAATIDETGDIYYVVVADGASAPTTTEVINGQESGGGAALKSGSATATTTLTESVTGLSASTAYDVYFVARDDESTPNVQASVTLVDVTTSAPADVTPPSVSVTTTSSDPTNDNPIPVTITFSEEVDEFNSESLISVTGASLADFASPDSITFTVNATPTGDGTVEVSVGASVTTDLAGNNNTVSNTLSLDYDGTAPTVTVTTTSSDPTNDNPIPVTITFSEEVDEFNSESLISVTGATLADFASADSTTFTANATPTGDGTVEVSVGGSVTTDLAGNNNSASNTLSLDYDGTAPSGYSVTIDESPIFSGNDSNIGFTFASAEVGADYSYTFTSSGGAGSVTNTGTVASATDNITGIDLSGLPDGTITLSVTLTDASGNTGAAATDTETKDSSAPSGFSVTIDESPINSGNETNIGFTFASAEVGADYSYTFSTSGGAGTVSNTGTITTATDNITGIDLSSLSDGTITLSVTLTDTNGNTSSASTDTETKDSTAPSGYSVTIDESPINSSNDTNIGFTFASAEVGADYSYTFTSSGGAGSVSNTGTIATATDNITGIDLSGLPDGTITINVTLTDTNGNTGSAASDTETKDSTPPSGYSVTIDESPIFSANDDNVGFTFAGAEVGADYSYTFTSSGGAGSVSNTGTITTATDNITGIDLSSLPDGTITLSVTITDVAGNTGSAATDTETKDSTAPSGFSVTIDQTPINIGNESSIDFTFSGAEVGADFSYTFTSSGGAGSVSNTGTIATATDNITGIDLSSLPDGTITLSVTLTDTNGNTSSASTDTETKDATAPTVAITRQTAVVGSGASATTAATSVVFRVTFSENVNNVDATDFTLSGTAASKAINGLNTVSSTVYDITVDSYTGTGTINLDFTAHDITDDNGNSFGGTITGTEEEYEIVNPDTDSDIADAVATNEQTSQIDYTSFQGANGSLTTSNTVRVYTFTVTDAGTTDAISTELSSLAVDITSGNQSEIRSLAIYDGSTFIGSTGSVAASNNISLTSNIIVTDGGSEDFDIYVSFNTSVTDNNQFVFSVTGSTPVSGKSSVGTHNAVSSNAGVDNTIMVGTTQLTIISEPTAINTAGTFGFTVNAEDANGNLDLDFSEDVTVDVGTTKPSGGNVSGTTTVSPVSGVYTWSGLSVNKGGDYDFDFISDETLDGLTTAGYTYSTAGGLSVTSSVISGSDASSDIIENATFTYNQYLNYIQYNATNIDGSGTDEVIIAKFDVRDGGGLGDTDKNSTEITDISFDITSGADNLSRIALYDDDNAIEVAEQAVNVTSDNTTITFSGISIIVTDLDATPTAGVGTLTIALRASFKQNTDVDDQDVINVEISSVTEATGGSRSLFAYPDGSTDGITATATSLAAGENQVDVVATKLTLTNDAGLTGSSPYERVSGNITPSIEARDVNGNLDLDETSEITITGPTDFDGSSTTSFEFSLVNGSASPSFTVFTEEEDVVLSFADNDGNTGSRTGSVSIGTGISSSAIDVYDTTAPTITSTSPSDDASTVLISTSKNMSITFSEDVSPISGGQIQVVSNHLPPDVFTLRVDNASEVSVSGNFVSLTLPELLRGGSVDDEVSYYVLIDNDAFDDTPNNGSTGGSESIKFGGISNSTTWNFGMQADGTPPEVVITRNDVTNGSFTGTNDTSISFDLAFSEEIDDSSLGLDDITISLSNVLVGGNGTGGTANTFGSDAVLTNDGDDQNYTLTLSNLTTTPSTNGTLNITIGTGYTDANGISPVGSEGPSNSFTIDQTAAGVSSASISSDNAFDNLADVGNVVTLTIEFNEALSSTPVVVFKSGGDVVNDDVTVVNTSGNIYEATYTVDVLDSEGSVTFSLNHTDAAGNDGGPETNVTDASTVTFDNSAPTVTIARVSDEYEGASDLPVVFDITFNEDVSNVDISDFVISGTAGATVDGALVTTTANRVFQVSASSPTGDGVVNLDFVGGQNITDHVGNAFVPASGITSEESYVYDATVPTVVINDDHADAIVKDSDEVVITAKVSDTNGLSATPTISIGTLVTNAAMTSVGNGTDFTYTWNVPAGDFANQSISISGTDPAGNSIAAPTAGTGPTAYTVDNTAPSIAGSGLITIGTSNPTPYTGTSGLVGDDVQIAFTVSEDLSTNPSVQFYSGNVSNPGIANGDATIGGTAPNYTATYTINDLDNSGDVHFKILLTDIAGNQTSLTTFPTSNVSLSGSAKVDADAPELEDINLDDIDPTRGTASATNETAISYTIDFSEAVNDFSYPDDINLNSSGVTITTVNLNPLNAADTTWVLSLSGISGNGTISFNLINNGGTPITDGVGNKLSNFGSLSVEGTGETVTFDQSAPGVSFTKNTPTSGSTTTTNADEVSFAVRFNQSIDETTFTLDDVRIDVSGTDVAVGGFAASTIASTINLTTASTVTLESNGDNKNYTVTVANITGNGSLGISLVGSGIQDLADNYLGGGTGTTESSATFAVDNTQPVIDALTLEAPAEGSTAATTSTSVQFNIDFSSDLDASTLDLSDFTVLTTGTVGYSGTLLGGTAPDAVTYTVNGLTGNGQLGLQIAGSGVFDLSDNTLDVTNPIVATADGFGIDNANPSIVITRDNPADGTPDHTKSSTIVFDLAFSEVIDNATFDLSDVMVNLSGVTVGGAGSGLGTSFGVDASLTTSDNQNYKLTFTNVAGNGTLGVVISGSGILDPAENQLAGGVDQTSSNFTIDQTNPTVVSFTRNLTTKGTVDNTNDDQVVFSLELSEAIDPTTFDLTDVQVNIPNGVYIGSTNTNGLTADNFGADITYNTSDNTNFTFTINNVSGDGSLGLTLINSGIQDLSDNFLENGVDEVSPDFLIDNTAPVISNVSISSNNPNSSSLATSTSNDIVTLSFQVNDQLNAAADTVINISSGGRRVFDDIEIAYNAGTSTYTGSYAVNEIDRNGTVTFSISVTDDAGNVVSTAKTAVDDASSVSIDQTPPSISSVTRNALPANTGSFTATNSDAVSYSIVFSEKVYASSFELDDIDITNTASTGTPSLTSSDDKNYTLEITGITGDGYIEIHLLSDDLVNPGDSISDLAGNAMLENSSVSARFTIVNTFPTVTIDPVAPNTGSVANTNSDEISFDIAFSKAIDNATIDESDFVIRIPDGVLIDGNSTTGLTGDNFGASVALSNDGDNTNYTLTISNITGDGSIGITLVGAGVQDVADNYVGGGVGVDEASSDDFIIDNIAPELTISLYSNNDYDQHATDADTVFMSIQSTDKLTEIPGVDFYSGNRLVLNTVTVEDDAPNALTNFTAYYKVDGAGVTPGLDKDQNGQVTYNISFTDDAGNVGSVINHNDGSNIEIDHIVPSLTYVSIYSDNGSLDDHAIEGTNVYLEFEADDDLRPDSVEVTFHVGGVSVRNTVSVIQDGDDSTYYAAYLVDVLDTDTDAIEFTIDFYDDAGNQGQQVTTTTDDTFVEIDKTAPTLNYVAMRSDNATDSLHARLGDDDFVAVYFGVDDDLEFNTLPDVKFWSGGEPIDNSRIDVVDDGDGDYYAEYGVASGDGTGLITFSIDLNDDAGNSLTTVDTPTNGFIEFDTLKPILTLVNLYTDNTTDSQHAKGGDIVFLEFTSNDTLSFVGASMTSGVNQIFPQDTDEGAVEIFYVDESTSITNFITYYTVDGDGNIVGTDRDQDGPVNFAISYTDDAGNEGELILNTTTGAEVEIDNEKPSLSSVSLSTNNGTLTDHAQNGSEVYLDFSATDVLSVDPDVVFISGGDTITVPISIVNTGGNDYRASFTVDASITDSPDLKFYIAYVDDVGLRGDTVRSTTDDSFVEIDKIAPTLSNIGLSSNNTTDNQHGVAGNTVTLRFEASDDLSDTPVVTFTSGGDPVGSGVNVNVNNAPIYTATYTVQSGDTEGLVGFTINYVDDAGNNGVEETAVDNSSEIEIDHSDPTVTALTISSGTAPFDHAQDGEEVTIYMTFDDDLAGEPNVVNLRSGSAAINGSITYTETSDFNTDGVEQWTAAYTVDPNDGQGDITFSVNYTDDAGNDGTAQSQADLTSGTTVEVDYTEPELQNWRDTLRVPSNTDPITVFARFDEAVTRDDGNPLDGSEFTITNGTLQSIQLVPGSDIEYGITIVPDAGLDHNDPSSSEDVLIVLNDGSLVDDAYNYNSGQSGVYTVQYDNVPPIITLDTAVNGRILTVTVELDEPGTVYIGIISAGLGDLSSDDLKYETGLLATPANVQDYEEVDIRNAGVPTTRTYDLDEYQQDYVLFVAARDKINTTNLVSNPEKMNIKTGGVTLQAPSLTDICINGDYYQIPEIKIEETLFTDFREGSELTISVSLPANFVFDPSKGNVISNQNEITITSASPVYNTQNNGFTISYDVTGTTQKDTITISDLWVRASDNGDLQNDGVSNVIVDVIGASVHLLENDKNRELAYLSTVPPFNAAVIINDVANAPTDVSAQPYILDNTSVVLGDPDGDGIAVYDYYEVDVNADIPFSIITSDVQDVVNVYSDQSLTNLVYTETTNSSSPTIAEYGLTQASVGINTFWVTTQRGSTVNSCESAPTKVSIAIIRVDNDPDVTSYFKGGEGSTLKLTYPSTGYTEDLVEFTGVLVETERTEGDNFGDGQAAVSYSFQPEANFNDTRKATYRYTLTNTENSVSANFWLRNWVFDADEIVINDSINIEQNGVCMEDGIIPFEIFLTDSIDYDGKADDEDPDFYTIHIYDYQSGARGVNLDDEIGLSTPATIVSNIPSSTEGWSFDPYLAKPLMEAIDSLQFTYRFEVVLYVADEITGDTTEIISEFFTIYKNPEVTITNVNDYYCEDDGDFNITYRVVSNVGTENAQVESYELRKYADNSYGSIVETYTFNDALLNPADPNRDGNDYLTEDETGFYEIYFVTPVKGSAQCLSDTTFRFEILSKPNQPELSNDFTEIGGFDLDNPEEYLLEYCEGSTIEDLVATISPENQDVIITWYNDGAGTSVITQTANGGSDQQLNEVLKTANAFFNGKVDPIGRQTKEFYFTITDHRDLMTGDINNQEVGCESEVRKVTIEIYPEPAVPTVTFTDDDIADTTLVVNKAPVSGVYTYEYCAAESEVISIEDIILDNTLDTETGYTTETYFRLFDKDGEVIDTLGTQLTMSDDYLGEQLSFEGLAGNTLSFFVSQTNYNNNYPNDRSAEFVGCESGQREFFIDINVIPDAPDTTQFDGGRTDYYMCSGETMPDITPPTTNDLYKYYSDVGGAPGELIPVAAFNGARARQSDLDSAGVFNNVSYDTATTYTYWITQVTDINEASDFKGCESAASKITVTVYPDSPPLTFDKTYDKGYTVNGRRDLVVTFREDSIGSQTFPLNGITGAELAYYATLTDAENIFIDPDGQQLPLDSGVVGNRIAIKDFDDNGNAIVTAQELLISSATQSQGQDEKGAYYFRFSQSDHRSEEFDFADGCESELDSMAWMTVYIRDIPVEPRVVSNGNPILSTNVYLNEDSVAKNGIQILSESDLDASKHVDEEVRWYVDVDNNNVWDFGVTDTLIFTGKNPTANDLGLTGELGNSFYRFFVTQTQDINFENTGFLGSESEPLTVTVLQIPEGPSATPPGSKCQDDVTATNVQITYSGMDFVNNEGVELSGTQSQFKWYESESDSDPIAGLEGTTSPADPTAPPVYIRNWQAYLESKLGQKLAGEYFDYYTLDDSLLYDTIYVSQEFSVGLGNARATVESPRTAIPVYFHPRPITGEFDNGEYINMVKGCDEQEIIIQVKLANMSATDAEFFWFARGVELKTGSEELIDDSIAQYIFKPSEENADRENRFGSTQFNLGAGDVTFDVSIWDKRQLDDLDGSPDNIDTDGGDYLCNGSASATFEIGTTPQPRFRWEKITAGNSTDFYVGDLNPTTSDGYAINDVTIAIPSLDYSEMITPDQTRPSQGIERILDTLSYAFQTSGEYEVWMTLNSNTNCIDSISRTITILELLDISNEGLSFDYENGDQGWLGEYLDVGAEYDSSSTAWEVGKEANPVDNVNESSYWITTLGGSYPSNKESALYSPAFDISSIESPTVSFDHFRDLDNVDGVVLEFSYDDGLSWNVLGDWDNQTGTKTGYEWYNTQQITILPQEGNVDRDGWNGSSGNWVFTANKIPDSLKQKDAVRFRFLFASDPGTKTKAGFAFDNFRIYNKQKNVLIEQFSSLDQSESESANASIQQLVVGEASSDAIWVNYYSDQITKGDALSERNRTAPGARMSYYGISRLPNSALNGIAVGDPGLEVIDSEDQKWHINQYNGISLEDPDFEIMDPVFSGDENEINAVVSFEALDSITNDREISFRFVIIEKEVTVDGKIYQNVVRKMLPSASGFTALGPIDKGDADFSVISGSGTELMSDFEISWDIPRYVTAENGNLALVVFVQQDLEGETKVLQAKEFQINGKSTPEPDAILSNRLSDIDQFTVYPNPADKSFFIQFENPVSETMGWKLFDQTGREAMIGTVREGELELEILSNELPSGIYVIQFYNNNENWMPQRVMIKR